jgi:RNA polymerase sigma factor (sigma-70 family)
LAKSRILTIKERESWSLPPLMKADRRNFGRTPTDAELLQSGYRYALALTHHRADAEDLVQESWLNLCRRYGEVASCAVLIISVRNLFIDGCRRKRIVAFVPLDEQEPGALPAGIAEELGLRGDIDALLRILRPNEREVLFLHYYCGHTAEEIARTSNRPRGSVLSMIHRAIAKLRERTAGSFERSVGVDRGVALSSSEAPAELAADRWCL